MKIDTVSIENFRTLEGVSVSFSGYYTAVSGQNNAGKTTLLRAIRTVFGDRTSRFYTSREDRIEYEEDRTQWATSRSDIVVEYQFQVSVEDDPGLYKFVEKFVGHALPNDVTFIRLQVSYNPEDARTCQAWVDDTEFSVYSSNELLHKMTSSTLALMHDSYQSSQPFYFRSGSYLHELAFSPDDLKGLRADLAKIRSKVQRISKDHRNDFDQILGRLNEKYNVEFSLPEGYLSGSFPFSVNLKDKHVDVPLDDWGSGTKNRTQILMSMLHANRIKSEIDENKITPLILIEEPESFLHPSAQAEFGRVLIDLANTLKIQTIVTTHSPYMLCQSNSASNVLLRRSTAGRKAQATEVVKIEENNWMEPFGKILGLDNAEFAPWKEILVSDNQFCLFVEGDIDVQYIKHIDSLGFPGLTLPKNIEIKAYDGKDALKNPILLKFIVEKLTRVLVSFDLDAKAELDRTMGQAGLKEGVGFVALGVSVPGKDRIEGLVPDRIRAKVYAENPDVVAMLSASENKDRKSANSRLKQEILREFMSDRTLNAEDLKGFLPLFKAVNTRGG